MADDSNERSLPKTVLVFILKILWNVFVILTPILGFWLASSLSTFFNGSMWLPYLAGFAAFPLLPLVWETVAQWHFNQKVEEAEQAGDDEIPERILTFWDRFILRTLAVNLVFLTALAGWYPQKSFAALSTRGDWMLEGQEGEWVQPTRDALFETANMLEWLYEATRENPFEKYAEDEDRDVPTPEPNESDSTDSDDRAEEETDSEDTGSSDDESDDEPVSPDRPDWPPPDRLHPAVASIPESAESSIESVAKYIDRKEDDPYQTVKAIYDWTADNIAYDAKALAAGKYPPQDAETVFETKMAVCAGYSKLMKAFGEELGIKVVYVTGDSRERDGSISGSGHAWNAIRVGEKWFLADVTWGAGYVNGTTFHKRYEPNYLFTPPKLFSIDHFPDDENWQLREDPISRGEFMRQPMLKPSFYVHGFELEKPTRSQVTVYDDIEIKLDNPKGHFAMARLERKGGKRRKRCRTQTGDPFVITCSVDSPGTYYVSLLGSADRRSTYWSMGRIEFHRR